MLSEIRKKKLLQELKFVASKSSGPGGQHVNKVNTKIELRFNVKDSEILTKDEKDIILSKLANKLTSNYDLIITVQTTRSQLKNRKEAIQKFIALIEQNLLPTKKRKVTKPSLASLKKRIKTKKQLSLKKNLRKKPEL